MNRCAAAILMLMLCLGVAPRAFAQEEVFIAILPLKPLGTDQDIAAKLETFLYAEVKGIKGVKLQDRDDTTLTVEQANEVNGACDGNNVCLAEMGTACAVDKLVYGTVATLGDSHVLDLKLIDVRSRTLERRKSITLTGRREVLIDGVRAVALQLIAPELYVGRLLVKLQQPGAAVIVDGVTVGSTPLEAIENLSPGKHAVKIVLTGYRDFDRFVEVRFGRTTIIDVALSGNVINASIVADENAVNTTSDAPVLVITEPAKPETKVTASPFESPLFLTGAGTGGAGLLVMVVGLSVFTTCQIQISGLNSKYLTADRAVKPGLEDEFEAQRDYWLDGEGKVIWYSSIVASAVGAAIMTTGVALMAWDYFDRPYEVEASMEQ